MAASPAEAVVEIVEEALRHAAAAEQLVAAARTCRLTMEMIASLADDDKELLPELSAAGAKLSEVVDALTRAHEFALARRDVRLVSLTQTLEGGTPT